MKVMKKFVLLFFGIISIGLNAQSKIICNEKKACEKMGNDAIKCVAAAESSSFQINKEETAILHSAKIETTYYIDSKKYDEKSNITIYQTHTKAAEKIDILIGPKTVIISSIDHANTYSEYKIERLQ